MERTRNFISQRCGRAVASFAWEDHQAVVTIAFAAPVPGTLRFVLDDLPFPQAVGDAQAKDEAQEQLQDQAMRIAIGRMHHNACKETEDGGDIHISMAMVPWKGDFTDADYGRGTSRFRLRGDDAVERRNPASRDAENVDSGARMCQAQGYHAARSFLKAACVPPSVIRRVLSKSTAKRTVTGEG